eukprot:scaffold138002_cov21-Tisochrysis_lutea.AAC.2
MASVPNSFILWYCVLHKYKKPGTAPAANSFLKLLMCINIPCLTSELVFQALPSVHTCREAQGEFPLPT